MNTRVKLQVGEESFSYAFKRVTQPGFSALYSSKAGVETECDG